MAPVWNLIEQWRMAVREMTANDLPSLRTAAAASARDIAHRSKRAVVSVAKNAEPLINAGDTLITHSLSATVVEVFRRLSDRGVKAIISESRPLYEGRHMADILSRMGVETTLITYAQMGLFAAHANLALTGADSLLEDGSTVNKAGTYLLALAARDVGIPFYVCCEDFKRRRTEMEDFRLEEMDPAELDTPDLPGVSVANIYFDVTPASMISAWITEQGLIQAPPP